MVIDTNIPPQPEPDSLTRPFWDACGQGRLEVSACRACGHVFLPPGPRCPRCWSGDIAARAASGEGTVHTFAVYRRTYHPALPAPYVVAVIALAEGPRIVSSVTGCAPEEVRIDMPVRVRFEKAGAFMLPRFAPADAGGGPS